MKFIYCYLSYASLLTIEVTLGNLQNDKIINTEIIKTGKN